MKRIFITFMLLILFSLSANAADYNMTLGDSQADLAGFVADGSEQYSGNGSWANNTTVVSELYLPLTPLGTFTIDDIKTIYYYSKKPIITDGSNPYNYFLKIYTEADGVNDDASWYGYRLNAEPYFANSLNGPANTWNRWNTDAGTNQLVFFDANRPGVGYGFYGSPALQDLQAGTVDWGTWKAGASGSVDYGPETVKYIAMGTGSAWNSIFNGNLDKIYIELNSGNTLTIDLESNQPSEVWVDDDWAGSTAGQEVESGKYFGINAFDNIQDGINAVINSTVNVANGTYVLSATLNVNKHVDLVGESQAGVIIDASGRGTGYGIQVMSDDVTMRNFTILPPIVAGSVGTSGGGGYAIHATFNHTSPYSEYQNLTLRNITIENGNRTAFDIHGYDGVVLENLTARNAAYGNGVQLTGCENATVTGLTCENNAWGSIAAYCSKSTYLNRASDNITFDFALNNIDAAFYVEDEFGLTNTNINVLNWTYAVNNEYNSPTAGITYYVDTPLQDALDMGAFLNATKFGNLLSVVYEPGMAVYHVGPGMLIQRSIDVAATGNDIYVHPGLYKERISISKSLALHGATYNLGKNGYTRPAAYAWDSNVESIIRNPDPALTTSNVVDILNTDDVLFEGFVVQSLNALPSSANDHLVRIYAHTQGCDNITVRNNVIGPNTNTTAQLGANGRMGLYLAAPNYSDFDITNSTFEDNLIYDCLGNGNNVFIWGGAEGYSSERGEFTGTIFENNEICGSHRSGIEMAGSCDGLVIKNNKIYDNGDLSNPDPALKYGNGIVIIRMGSDKTSLTGEGPDNLTIYGNEIYDNEKNGIYMGPVNSNYKIYNNYFHDNGFDAVVLDLNESYHSGATPVYNATSNIQLNYNVIIDNTGFGARVIGSPTNGFILDGEFNWWGDCTGPTHSSNPSGIGEEVSDNVDFDPWIGHIDSFFDVTFWLTPSLLAGQDGNQVSLWEDASCNGHDATMPDGEKQPVYHSNPGIEFITNQTYGMSDAMKMDYSADITSDVTDEFNPELDDMSLLVTFRPENLTDRQVIFKAGETTSGYVIYMDNGYLCAGMYNKVERKFIIHTTPLTAGQWYMAHLEYTEADGLRLILDNSGSAWLSLRGLSKDGETPCGVGAAVGGVRFHDYNTALDYSRNFDGIIGDVMLGHTDDFTGLYAYLGDRYGITTSYPAPAPRLSEDWEYFEENDAEGFGYTSHIVNVYPNPFGENAQITVNCIEGQNIRIELFDASGRKVQSVYSGSIASGNTDFNIDGTELNTGVYMIKVSGGTFTESHEIIIIK